MTPEIGADLYEELVDLCEHARSVATVGRNFHAAALYVVLEALRVQAEHSGTNVSIFIEPRGAMK